uniref:SJCHGC09759 protein n=1 Tax=Schistosoma japonicum TaxID=6182 RepID=Q5BQY6_SCHJA|nr:SJCHGC09759 protein [Schistosoma japonicum]
MNKKVLIVFTANFRLLPAANLCSTQFNVGDRVFECEGIRVELATSYFGNNKHITIPYLTTTFTTIMHRTKFVIPVAFI